MSLEARPVLVCPAEAPICPNCHQPLHRVHASSGSFYAHCRNKTSEGPERRRCGQHVYVTGMADRTCMVVPLSRAEFQELSRSDSSPREVYERTEVLR